MTPDIARLQRLLGAPELAALRQRLRARFRRAAPAPVITLSALSVTERHALEGLLGRPASQASSLRVTPDELDRAFLRAGLAGDLRAALEALDGPLEAHEDLARREQDWATVAASAADPRLREMLRTAAGLGLLKRIAGDPRRAATLLAAAAQVLARLPARGTPLAELAAATVHDAHALDPGRGLAALVLRAAEGARTKSVTAASSAEEIDDDERRRSRWARQGVAVNELAAPALCLNLVAGTDTVAGRLLTAARAAGEPLHLSLRSLLRAPPTWEMSRRTVFVCENPAVVAIAAERLGAASAPLVCTSGMPAAAQRVLLTQLAASGVAMCYHGDFDWPGLRIGNFVMRSFGARPWRFGAQDYAVRSGRALEGLAVAAQWDAQLAPAMVSAGFALDEEAVVDSLIEDLRVSA